MSKSIVKEIIIILLLTLSIILVLGVVLYGYLPINKVIPEKVSYSTPESVKSELQTDNNIDDSQVVFTHQIDSTDLSNYKTIKEYVPGKKNPFESVTERPENAITEGTTTTSGTTVGQPAPSSSTTSTQSTSGTSTSTGYLPDKGTK